MSGASPCSTAEQQIMRLTDISLDVKSEAAFGLLGTAARAAIPYLQKSLADNAVVDLKPFAANAQKSIEAAIADFQAPVDGVEVEASVKALRLVGIEFDSTTLRVIARSRRHRPRAGAQDRAAINRLFINSRAEIPRDLRNHRA